MSCIVIQRLLMMGVASALLGCGASFVHIEPIEPTPGTFAFGGAERVGQKTRRTDNYHIDIQLVVSAGFRSVSRHVTGEGRSSRLEEILEVTPDGHASKLRVTFELDSLEFAGDLKESTSEPTVGKTYIVTTKSDGAIDVALEKGGEMTDKERKAVTGEFDWVKKSLPPRTKNFVVGEEVKADLLPAFERDAAQAGINVSKVSAIYRGRHGNEGVFDLDVRFSQKTPIESGGEVEVLFISRGELGRTEDDRNGEYTGAGMIEFRGASGGAAIEIGGTFVGTGRWQSL